MTAVLTLLFVCMLVVWRRRLLSFTVVGVYLVSFILMNAIGVNLIRYGGPQFLLLQFSMRPETPNRALLILDLGILSVLAGVAIHHLIETALRQPARAAPPPARVVALTPPPLGLAVDRLLALTWVAVFAFAVLFVPFLPGLNDAI